MAWSLGHKSKNNLCKNFSSKNSFKFNVKYVLMIMKYNFITKPFQVFHVFENC